MTHPYFAVTMGDAAGIGPEVTAKALFHPQMPQGASPLVIGDAAWMQGQLKRFGLPGRFVPVEQVPLGPPEPGTVPLLQPPGAPLQGVALGRAQAPAGEAAYRYVLKAVELAQAGQVKAIVTAPLCKESLHLAGHYYDGHTGLMAELCHCTRYRMTFCTLDWRILHVTAHVSLKEAIRRLTPELVLETLQIGQEHLNQLGLQGTIAVAGLNPHASEGGIFGDEEQRIIEPALAQARALGIACTNPLPPDVVFRQMALGAYPMVISMIHDHGHLAGKLLAFDRGVNVSLGLPVIRTSVDHGTAFDIAAQGIANPLNLHHAYAYALLMAGL